MGNSDLTEFSSTLFVELKLCYNKTQDSGSVRITQHEIRDRFYKKQQKTKPKD